MKPKYTCLLFAFVLFLSSIRSSAQNFDELAPLHAHLTAINGHWQSLDVADERIAFASDADRIQRHLFEAHALLTRNTPAHFDDVQLEQRRLLLERLYAYAEARQFPVNTDHPIRTPYFVDHFGTPCAVAHLMLEAQDQQLVASVNHDFNFSYIADMPQQPIEQWASEHGFEVYELQLIQPAYGPTYPTSRWRSTGANLNGPVHHLEYDPVIGRTCMAGSFDTLGMKCFACVTDGGAVQSFNSALSGTAYDFVKDANGNYAIAGSFGFMRLVGSTWTAVSVTGLPNFASKAITADGDHLYFSAFDQTTNTSAVCQMHVDSTAVHILFTVNGPVNDLLKYSDLLIAGGAFDQASGQGPPLMCNNLVSIDLGSSSLSNMHCNFHGYISALRTINGQIYAGGDCTAETEDTASCLLVFDGVNEWNSIIDSASRYGNWMFGTNDLREIKDLFVYRDTVLVAGDLHGNTGRGLHGLNTSSGHLQGFAHFSGSVHHLTTDLNGKLLVGGDFRSYWYTGNATWPGYLSSQEPVGFTAVKVDSLVGISEQPGTLVNIFPNPTVDALHVPVESPVLTVQVFDLSGREVEVPIQATNKKYVLDVKPLPPGMYILQMRDFSGEYVRQEFVVGSR